MEYKSISGGKMVSDFDDSSIPKNYYPPVAINLKNGRYIGRVGSCGGNTLSSWTVPSGTNRTVTSVVDDEDKLIYFLVYNSLLTHSIVELDTTTDTSTVIFQTGVDSASDIFGWTSQPVVSSIKFIDGGDVDEYGNKVSNVLVWTDANTEIKYFNIGKSRRYKFAGSSTVVNSGGVCTLSHPAIIPCNTLRYVYVSGVWYNVLSVGTGSLVINGVVADGTYTDVVWSYRDLVQQDEITLIKSPPSIPVQAEYLNDSTISFNNLRGDMYQFISAYVYDDNEQSAWSVTSKVPIPQSDLANNDLTSLIDNSMQLTVNTGARGVKGVKVAFRRCVNSPNNYYQLQYIDKKKLGLGDNQNYNITFLNNENYVPIAVSEVSNLDQDYVPKKAGCLEYINNGSLVFGDVTNGYDQGGVDMSTSIVTESLPTILSTLDVSYSDFATSPGVTIRVNISGVAYAGDSVRIITYKRSFGSGGGGYSDTALQDETITVGSTESFHDFAHRLLGRIFFYCSGTYTTPTDTTSIVQGQDVSTLAAGGDLYISSIVVTHTTTEHAISVSSLALKTGSAYKLGVVYGTNYGRKSPVQYSDGGYFKTLDYFTLNGMFQTVQWQINSKPPAWADWYAIVATKNLTHLNTYYGVAEKMSIDTTKPNLITVYIENMNEQYTANGINFVNYNFAVNDRFKFLAQVGTTTSVYSTAYDSEILSDTTVTETGVTRRVLIIRLPSGFDTSVFSTTSGTVSTWVEPVLFEAYSPKKTSDIDNVFYHIGYVFPVLNAGTDSRAHQADIQTQTSTLPAIGNISGIDCFMKPRLMPHVENDASPVPTTVEDFNLSDYYKSSFSSLGTATIEDPTYREVRRKATLIHTDPFIPQTNINGLNRVYPGYYRDYDLTMGAFKRLINKGTFIQAIHESNSQRIPVNAVIITSATGALQLGLSSDLLNDGIRYNGSYGIGNNSSAIIDTGTFIYAIDPIKGRFLRLGLDGWDDIGIECGFSQWIHDQCALYTPYSNLIKVGYDPYDKEVIISFAGYSGQPAQTVAYSEKLEGFVTFYSYVPECMQNFGTKFYSFNAGSAWVHDDLNVNKWYGTSYPTSFDLVFNSDYDVAKICRYIKIFSNVIIYPGNVVTDIGCQTTFDPSMFDIDVSTDLTKGPAVVSIDGVFSAPVPFDANSPGGIYDGLPVRGKLIRISFATSGGSQSVSIQGVFLGYGKL